MIKTIWQPVPTHCEVMGICQGNGCRTCPNKDSFRNYNRELPGRTTEGTKPNNEMRKWIVKDDV